MKKSRTTLKLALVMAFIMFFPAAVHGAQQQEQWETAGIESDYLLSAGGISDGTNLWVIPYEKDSFAKVNLQTGEKENLSHTPNYDKLRRLAGYKSGALYTHEGRQYLLLAPHDVGTPVARVALETLEVDFPMRDGGYYFGNAHVNSDEGGSYLWMIPETKKPLGTTTRTEIVKVNLDTWQKEAAISTDIDGEYYSFSNSLVVEGGLWLLPAEEGQPLMQMDMATAPASLADMSVKKIYSSEQMRFSKLPTGIYDGTNLGFVAENPSFMFNESTLYRCDKDGNPTEVITLTKDHYCQSAVDGEYLYLCAGAQGMQAKNLRLSLSSGKMEAFDLAQKSGYVPAQVVPAGENGIYILPETKDGRKKPLLRVVGMPETTIQKTTQEKIYRNYGDESVGAGLSIQFQAPGGLIPTTVYWFVSGMPFNDEETLDSFTFAFNGAEEGSRRKAAVNNPEQMNILANKNGNYRFMTEYVDETNQEQRLYTFSQVEVGQIYERLPVAVKRYDIDQQGDGALIEEVVYNQDFGAAFSYDGKAFLDTDLALDITPTEILDGTTGDWILASEGEQILRFDQAEITPEHYEATVSLNYRLERATHLNEGDTLPDTVVVSNFKRDKNFGMADDDLMLTFQDNSQVVDVEQKGQVIEIVVKAEEQNKSRSVGEGGMLLSAKEGWDPNDPLRDPEKDTGEPPEKSEESEPPAPTEQERTEESEVIIEESSQPEPELKELGEEMTEQNLSPEELQVDTQMDTHLDTQMDTQVDTQVDTEESGEAMRGKEETTTEEEADTGEEDSDTEAVFANPEAAMLIEATQNGIKERRPFKEEDEDEEDQ